MADSLAPDRVQPFLRGRFGSLYRYEESCASTQRLLTASDAEGAIAVADEQTEGRGRLGRSWHAPRATSVLVSVLLRPTVESSRLPELTVVAGSAVAEAITKVTALETTIKLPNDVLIGGKKAAGVLAESVEGRVVLGIGVNVNQTVEQLPRDAQIEPTSLRLELGKPVDRADILVAVLQHLERRYDAWLRGTSASG